MKHRTIILLSLAGCFLGVVGAWAIYILVTMPVLLGFDEQGHELCQQLKTEFDVPIDGMNNGKGIYTSANGLARFKHAHWVVGSAISIYGVTNVASQDKIIQRVQALADQRKYSFIEITFYDKSNFKISGTPQDELAVRLPSTEIRRTTVNP